VYSMTFPRSHRRGRAVGRTMGRGRFRRPTRGVSDVVATILLLALTVTLFASIFFFVTSFPSPPAQNSNQFQASLQLTANQSFVLSVTILHLGGPSVAGGDSVYLKGAVTPAYPSFTAPISVSTGTGGGPTWNLGQNWLYTFPFPQPRVQNITIYIVSPTQLLYSVTLPGQQFNVPPTVVNSWTSPTSPTVGGPFTIYAVFGGTVAGIAPTVNLAAIPGLPTTAQAMSAAGPTNEWKYLVTSGLTTANGTYQIVISGTNSVGQTGFGTLPVTILNSGGGKTTTFAASVLLSPSHPPAGSSVTPSALVTYTATAASQPLTVDFWVNLTVSPFTNEFTGVGPASATITGPSSVTVYSTTSWLIPAGPGNYTVTARAAITGFSTTGVLVFSTVNVVPSYAQGPTGDAVVVTGTGFTPSASATIGFAGATVTPTSCSSGTLTGSTIKTTGTGGFVCTITVPATASPGNNTLTGTDATTGSIGSAVFLVTAPTLTPSPSQGPTKSAYTLTGTGFSVSAHVTVTFVSAQTPTSCSSGTFSTTTITTTAAGVFVCSFTVPATAAVGADTISAADAGSGQTPTTTYTVTALALTLSPAQGPKSTPFTATASGLTPGGTATLTFSSALTPTGCTVGTFSASTITTSSSGGFVCTFTAPAGGTYSAAGTSNTVTLKDTSSADTTTATFKGYTPGITAGPSAGNGPGQSLYVNGTGFSVSNGVTVSLDGIVLSPTSCSTGTASGSSVTTSATGTFNCIYTIPGISAGTYTVQAIDLATNDKATTTFTVT
jgi:hypothetical protein